MKHRIPRKIKKDFKKVLYREDGLKFTTVWVTDSSISERIITGKKFMFRFLEKLK